MEKAGFRVQYGNLTKGPGVFMRVLDMDLTYSLHCNLKGNPKKELQWRL